MYSSETAPRMDVRYSRLAFHVTPERVKWISRISTIVGRVVAQEIRWPGPDWKSTLPAPRRLKPVRQALQRNRSWLRRSRAGPEQRAGALHDAAMNDILEFAGFITRVLLAAVTAGDERAGRRV
jgi:hypothetical protein